jgi:hypothetical protein
MEESLIKKSGQPFNLFYFTIKPIRRRREADGGDKNDVEGNLDEFRNPGLPHEGGCGQENRSPHGKRLPILGGAFSGI